MFCGIFDVRIYVDLVVVVATVHVDHSRVTARRNIANILVLGTWSVISKTRGIPKIVCAKTERCFDRVSTRSRCCAMNVAVESIRVLGCKY